MAFSYERFNRRYGPWISLALGVATVVLVRRGTGYAPVAVAFLLLGWMIALSLKRLLGPAASADAHPTRGVLPAIRRLAPAAAATASVGLYQNVLFYLVPVWAASACWPSSNMVFPVALGAMALFSCFEYPYRAHVLDRPYMLAAFSAVTLFAALVPALAVLVEMPLRYAMACAAGVAGLVAGAAALPMRGVSWRLRVPAYLAILGLSLGLAVSAGRFLPPVPVVCASRGAGTGIAERELEGRDDRFPAGVDRVYAWFSVAAPAGWRQPVRFQWYRDGVAVGNPIDHEVSGGREAGFRTWTWRSAPAPGQWRADLITDSGQLVGRVGFRVEGP